MKAFNEGLAQAMREDENVFVAGEDVAGYGGVFRMFDNLLDEFGPRRMIDTPISEAALVGLGVGAAARGLRPARQIQHLLHRREVWPGHGQFLRDCARG